ncbi:Fanconi anemia group F protein [Elgaria multicarinata webbii]|uniref:Fanconi anemia group F protein n=1 Tax=Elgaria multicarinata webbii TaxID=159646 RepID=UPI002FCD4457
MFRTLKKRREWHFHCPIAVQVKSYPVIGGSHRPEGGLCVAQTGGAKKSSSSRARPVAMETLLSQAEQLPSLLAASRSGLVRGWDPAALKRALSWGRFFQQLHSRLHTQPGLRAAWERRLSRGGLLGLGHLRRCPELLGLALLENRALPSAARRRLLRGLLLPGAGGEEEPFVHLLARRRAACQLLLVHLAPLPGASSAAGQREAPAVRAQAQLLLSRLREEGDEGGGRGASSSSALLEQLPHGPTLYRAVAAALLEPDAEAEAKAALLPWLLQGDPARLAAFCRLLPAPWVASLCGRHPELRTPYLNLLTAWGSRLTYDPLHGEWKTSALEEGEIPWQEMLERLSCLCQEPEPVGSAVRAQIRSLKAQDGDFEVRGLSVWTDLLLDLEKSTPKKPGRVLPSNPCTVRIEH